MQERFTRKNNNQIKFLHSERFRRLSKEGFWVILGQALTVLGSLVGVRVLTGLLDPNAYGELALGLTAAMLVNQTVLGPLSNGVARFYAPANEKKDLDGYLIAMRRLVLSATAFIVFILLFIIAGLLIAGQAKWIAIVIAAIIFAILSGYNSILNCIQNAARQRFIVAFNHGMESWLRFLVAAGLLLWLGATSTTAMMGYAVASILVLGSQYVFFQKIIPTHIKKADKERNWRDGIWAFSWPFSIFGMFTWLQLASDRWALKFFASPQDVGLYAALFQIGYYPVSMATGMAVQFLAPIFYQRVGDAGDKQRTASVDDLSWRLTWFVLGVTFIAFLAAFLFHPQIFRIFAAKKYGSVSYLLPWVLFAGGIFAAGQTMTLNLQSQMKTRLMITAKIITALFGVVLNFAGAYWYGTSGVVVAGVLFSMSYFLWMAALSKYNRKVQKSVFNKADNLISETFY